jgi:1-acyl-sn-glycerol-3-phosphate acyltransferase
MFRLFWILFLKLKGWNTKVVFPTFLPKCVIVVAPHTSSSDFLIGVAYRSVMRIKGAKFLGKAELFKPPFGFIFHWFGGIPVERSSKQNLVDQVVAYFNNNTNFRLALSPEGTRKKVEKLKTGFYYIAKQANVPIVMVGLDYKRKTSITSEPFYTTESIEKDFQHIIQFFSTIHGRYPELGLLHLKSDNS